MQYTPLLPAAATGTVEERSIVEPVRRIVGRKAWLVPTADRFELDDINLQNTAHVPWIYSGLAALHTMSQPFPI